MLESLICVVVMESEMGLCDANGLRRTHSTCRVIHASLNQVIGRVVASRFIAFGCIFVLEPICRKYSKI
ncbi:hypothetical protein C5167_027624 [Papaver somniferum]|nr:hypothetical protein C5167_027624 [Papaver somniferum]